MKQVNEYPCFNLNGTKLDLPPQQLLARIYRLLGLYRPCSAQLSVMERSPRRNGFLSQEPRESDETAPLFHTQRNRDDDLPPRIAHLCAKILDDHRRKEALRSLETSRMNRQRDLERREQLRNSFLASLSSPTVELPCRRNEKTRSNPVDDIPIPQILNRGRYGMSAASRTVPALRKNIPSDRKRTSPADSMPISQILKRSYDLTDSSMVPSLRN